MSKKLGIICGEGRLPDLVYSYAVSNGFEPSVFCLPSQSCIFSKKIANTFVMPHWGALGFLFFHLNELCIKNLIIVGYVKERPSLQSIRPDKHSLMLLTKLLKGNLGGDANFLGIISDYFISKGYKLLGVNDVAPQMVVNSGSITSKEISKYCKQEAKLAFELLDTLEKFDIGQAVVVRGSRVVAVEGAEGTDAMLDRVSALYQNKKVFGDGVDGVLVKGGGKQNSLIMDMPCIGPITVEMVHKARLSAIVLRRKTVVIIDQAKTLQKAEKLGVSIYAQ